MEMNSAETKFPKKIELEDSRIIDISRDMVPNENLFSLLYNSNMVDKIAINLIKKGFHDASPSLFRGERYSLSKSLIFPWEIHMRLFTYDEYGKIYAHLEVSRKYFEHLFLIQPVIYEPFEFYRNVYKKFEVNYEPENKKVSRFIENYHVKLEPPDDLIQWMPVVLGMYSELTKNKETLRELLDKVDNIFKKL